jgi:hypothetical protein
VCWTADEGGRVEGAEDVVREDLRLREE